MDELQTALQSILAANPLRLVLSAPKGGHLRRASAAKTARGWQLERLTATQAFHENLDEAGLLQRLAQLLAEDFAQLNAFAETQELSLRVSKKGKVLTNSKKLSAENIDKKPNKQRQAHLLQEGIAIPALVDAGVMTADGHPVAAKRSKWRQVARFVQLVDELLPPQLPTPLQVVDFGCGKSALTFVLYHYLTALRGADATVTGLDLKADVVAACNAAGQKYGYTGLRFLQGDIAGFKGEGAQLLVTLHACDTATDHALAKAVAWGTRWILSVPCCQHELNAQMHSEALAILTRYGLTKERTAALMTDALRANLLVACGYKVQLVEFIDAEHTPKNIMIRAAKTGQPAAERRRALEEARRLCQAFGFAPTLWQLLQAGGFVEAL